jgi:tetratricopeptide (TPR) repeat protein
MKRRSSRAIGVIAAGALCLLCASAAFAAAKTRNVVLIISDGLRWQEIFTGAEEALLNDAAGGSWVSDEDLRKRYWRAGESERRAALFPFLWGTVAKHGQIFGNQAVGSVAQVTNGLAFSYPGYNEMATGFPNPAIDSNEFGPNPTPTVFEWLNKFDEFKGRVAIYGTWNAFDDIFNKKRSGLVMQTGWTAPGKTHETARDALLRRIYETLTEVNEEGPPDALLQIPLLDFVAAAKPRVLFVGYGETDDWAHQGRYDLVLDSAHRFDFFVKQLWDTMQAMPEYRDRTTFIITTDHGRGSGLTEWKEHGVEEKGSENIWIAVIGPDTAPLGERHHVEPVTQAQIAATVAAFIGKDYPAAVPRAAEPIAAVLPAATHGSGPSAGSSAAERLGTVSFEVSCSPSVKAPFSRGVALLHDFWYDEAQRQFASIARDDPGCAMAHWGVAMSIYHQIWNRPDEDTMERGRAEMHKAVSPVAKTAREREYIAALSRFYQPGQQNYSARVEAYSAAMGELYRHHPKDTDAGAFYALSLLAAEAPDDISLAQEHQALAVLNPLFGVYPDHPGVVHYIIHACDTPSLAADGLAAARHYGEIAPSGAHAVHMPGHIFARLGMWPDDIRVNLASVAASQAALARRESDGMDQFHSDDFLLYAYLQSGQEARAKTVVNDATAALNHFEAMPGMTSHFMQAMFPYYRSKLPAFYALELRDWQAAAALEPVAGASPETQVLTYWARIVADGHLRESARAQADLAVYESLLAQVKQGNHAYYADSTAARIERGEVLAWVAFANGDQAEALKQMRAGADLQDKVGQGEVDIPAREMLADMLLEYRRPQEALSEYERALAQSPNRFNGLYNAGMAAEAAGDKPKAMKFYAALLESTDSGAHSARPEFDHLKSFMAASRVADN